MKTRTTLRALTISASTIAALAAVQTAHAQSIWDVLKAKAPGLASVMEAVVVNNSQAPTVVVQPQASAVAQTPAAAATPAPQASPVATSAPAPAAAASVAAQPSPAAQAGNGLKKGFDLMANRRPAQDGELPKNAKADSGVVGELDPGVMSAKEVSLTLADGNVLTARLQRSASDSKFNSQSWIGTIDGAEGSVLVLTKARGVISGFANFKDQIIEISPSQGGKHALYAVDQAGLPGTGEPLRYPQGRKSTSNDALSTMSDYGLGAYGTDAAANVVQDLLVVYTPAAAARYGTAGIESNIQSAVQAANQAYLNSQVGITLNLVGLAQAGFIEGSSLDATLSKLETDSATASLRNSLAADVVMVVAENGDYCGIANVMTVNSTSFAPYAHGAVYSSCLSNQSLAHEIGHLQGLEHDRENAVGYSGVYPYSYGYRVCASDGTGFRDIMSYSCSGAPRVLLFSNPNVTYNGYAAGVSYEANPSQAAENWRSLNNTAATVAAFRGGSTVSAVPTAPSGLAAGSASYNSVKLTWNDNSANETGFKLERSTDGANFAQIAAVGADVKTYSDGTVVPLTNYFYRVRAYNSVGNSAYSSTISVRTPDAPPPAPPAPTSVTAADNKDGTALVSWASGGSGADKFEVRRETWNSRKNAWDSATTAAIVPATMLSLVDSSGAGTFRYSLRATNAGGASSYAGPAQVSVTAPSSSGSSKKVPPGKSR